MKRFLIIASLLIWTFSVSSQDTLRINSWSAGEFETHFSDTTVTEDPYSEESYTPGSGGEAVVLMLDSGSSQRIAPPVEAARYYISPNPGTGLFYINSVKNPIRYISVFSPLGETIVELRINDKSWAAADLNGKPRGIYFARITDSKGNVKQEKLVIQ